MMDDTTTNILLIGVVATALILAWHMAAFLIERSRRRAEKAASEGSDGEVDF